MSSCPNMSVKPTLLIVILAPTWLPDVTSPLNLGHVFVFLYLYSFVSCFILVFSIPLFSDHLPALVCFLLLWLSTPPDLFHLCPIIPTSLVNIVCVLPSLSDSSFLCSKCSSILPLVFAPQCFWPCLLDLILPPPSPSCFGCHADWCVLNQPSVQTDLLFWKTCLRVVHFGLCLVCLIPVIREVHIPKAYSSYHTKFLYFSSAAAIMCQYFFLIKLGHYFNISVLCQVSFTLERLDCKTCKMRKKSIWINFTLFFIMIIRVPFIGNCTHKHRG